MIKDCDATNMIWYFIKKSMMRTTRLQLFYSVIYRRNSSTLQLPKRSIIDWELNYWRKPTGVSEPITAKPSVYLDAIMELGLEKHR